MNTPQHAVEITESVVTTPDMAEFASALRRTLPRQMALGNAAQAAYGLVMSGPDIKSRIADILPARRPGHILRSARYTVCARLEDYSAWIPDRALLIYEEARSTRAFQSFCIMWPTYDVHEALLNHRALARFDPWLVGWTINEYPSLHESNHSFGGRCHKNDAGIVLAYWDDATIHPPQKG